jgi:hypothetical protein
MRDGIRPSVKHAPIVHDYSGQVDDLDDEDVAKMHMVNIWQDPDHTTRAATLDDGLSWRWYSRRV